MSFLGSLSIEKDAELDEDEHMDAEEEEVVIAGRFGFGEDFWLEWFT